MIYFLIFPNCKLDTNNNYDVIDPENPTEGAARSPITT